MNTYKVLKLNGMRLEAARAQNKLHMKQDKI